MMISLLILLMVLTIHLVVVEGVGGAGNAGDADDDVGGEVMPRSVVLLSTKFLVPAATMLDNTDSHGEKTDNKT